MKSSMNNILFITMGLVLFSSCTMLEKAVVIQKDLTAGTDKVTVTNKTIVKSRTVEIGTKDANVLEINLAEGAELLIQCKNLRVNQNVIFSGNNVKVTIEYVRLRKNDHIVNSKLGNGGVYKIELKDFKF